MDFLRIAEGSEVCNLVQAKIAAAARMIAEAVIAADGTFDKVQAEKQSFEGSGYFDELFAIHVKKVLSFFIEGKQGPLRLRQLSFPLANPWVESLVGLSLLYPKTKKLEKRDISVATIAALLTFVRQSVGSCFATAPVILAQSEHIEFIFEDLYNLMTRGFLKRVIEGDEVRVPISTKIGPANIKEQSALMKCYEYTVAGFADWKINFSNWNMYRSLGLSHQEIGGIGEALYNELNLQLEATNREIEELYIEMQQTENHIRMQEALLRSAYREDEIRRCKIEIQVKSHHIAALQDFHYKKVEKTKELSGFFQYIIDQCILLFPSYFQEVYDPEMFVEKGEIYQDRPAGFRLLFKHGRYDPSFWTMIYTPDEYKTALIAFFKMIEIPLITASTWEEGKDLVPRLIDVVIERIQTPDYLENAFKRVAALQEESGKTPWFYVSGGNLEALMKCYFSLKNEPKSYVLNPEKPLDLLINLIELMKDLPYPLTSRFEKKKESALLMMNETHAFTFRPGLDPEFVKAWSFSGNTYTYIRDEFVKRALHQGEKKRNIHALIFADSNWENDFLGFVLNPKSEEVEIWRIGPAWMETISSWKNLFNGKEWKIFLNNSL
jgi:hypothetical protein